MLRGEIGGEPFNIVVNLIQSDLQEQLELSALLKGIDRFFT